MPHREKGGEKEGKWKGPSLPLVQAMEVQK